MDAFTPHPQTFQTPNYLCWVVKSKVKDWIFSLSFKGKHIHLASQSFQGVVPSPTPGTSFLLPDEPTIARMLTSLSGLDSGRCL